ENKNPILIKCFNCEARRRSCYRVLSPVGYVYSQYVAATAALNTQKIDCVIAFDNYVLPPPQHLILTKRTQEKHKFITKFAEKIDYDVHDIDKIFLPVVIQEHWICLLFAVKEQTIWVIDSLFPDPLSQHQDAINKLLHYLIANHQLYYLNVNQQGGWIRCLTFGVKQG
ncbi:putative ubiquitin-like-specific protease 1B, partial [Bienertia sinuspersici]